MTRWLSTLALLAALCAGGVACGKYGPPRRPQVSAAGAAAAPAENPPPGEECEDEEKAPDQEKETQAP